MSLYFFFFFFFFFFNPRADDISYFVVYSRFEEILGYNRENVLRILNFLNFIFNTVFCFLILFLKKVKIDL